MSILTDLVLLPFGLALEIVNMVLWIVSTVCEAAFSLIFDLVWFSMSTLEFMLEYTLIIVGHALFEWLPMLVRLLYRIVLYTAPIVRQFMEAIFQILASAWMFVYGLPWRATFVKVVSTSWDYTSSAASLFHRQGSYTVREVSRINYGAIFKHISETYVLLIFVGIVTCVLILQRQQKNRSRRKSSEENREREFQLRRRRSELLRRRHSRSRSQSASQDDDKNSDSTTTNVGAAANNTLSSDIESDDTFQESTDFVQPNTELTSDTELLRRKLHRANEELSQERDKFLCIVCQDLKREVILKPCNHYCLCYDCSRVLRECPICKSRIRNTEKIYHS